jgi:putative ABC transport system permease protein
MNVLIQDIKHAVRTFRRSPGFTLAALLVLALGIGANTAIFSIVYGVILRPLPYVNADRIVQLWHVPPQKSFPGMKQFALSAANYRDWEQQNHVFEISAIYHQRDARLTGGGEPQTLHTARVEPTFFSVYQFPAELGRTIGASDGEPGHDNVVVLSHKLWVSRYASDPNIVGKNIELDNKPRQVIGVMPARFEATSWASLWVPLVWEPEEKIVRGEHHFFAIARLKSGVTVDKAQAELTTIASRLAEQYPVDDAGWGAQVVPLHEQVTGESRKPLLILLGAVAFVLLIACANVANLMLAKTLDRKKELAIRTALGASRRRIVAQVLTESVLISVVGGSLGLIVAHFAKSLVINFLGASLPRLSGIRIDGTVLAFTFGIAVVTGVAAGVAPAWKLSNSDPNDALKQGGRTGSAAKSPTRGVLVVVEVALSLVLLVGAGLMIRTLWNLRNVDPGFEANHTVAMTIGIASTDYATIEQESAFLEQVRERVSGLPGVKAAAITDDVPLTGGSTQPIQVEGQPVVAMADQPEVSVRVISAGYMKTLQIPVRAGREFTESDTMKAPKTVVISESIAKRFWPNQNPIGKRISLTFDPQDGAREVVGVVGDIKDNGLEQKDSAQILYQPLMQLTSDPARGKFTSFRMQLLARGDGNPADSVPSITSAVHSISPNTPVTDVSTMKDIIEESISPQRFSMMLLAAFAVLAVFLAAVGIYSVLAYSVRQRVREIGIRIALGSPLRDVLRMIVYEGIRPTLLGVGIGLATSLALSRVLATLIFGVPATDMITFATVSAVLVTVGFLASLFPALRASRVDPLKTLREE